VLSLNQFFPEEECFVYEQSLPWLSMAAAVVAATADRQAVAGGGGGGGGGQAGGRINSIEMDKG